MKKQVQRLIKTTIVLFVLQVMMLNIMAQPIGSQIKVGTNSQISYWNGSAWIAVTPGLPGQSLQFVSGSPTWINNPDGITTNAVTNITGTTATSGGTVISDGGAPITISGVCWSTSHNPSLANSFTTDGTGIGNYTSNITGLTSGIIYYIRAYATNSVGTAYGNEVSALNTNGLVAYYPFNGNANDESGNGNNGVVQGATLTTDRFGNTNQSYSFDGISSYIQLNNNFPFTQNFSISLWVKSTTGQNPNLAYIFSTENGFTGPGGGFSIASYVDGIFIFATGGGGANWDYTSSNFYTENLWHHVVIKFDSIKSYLYVDGILDVSLTRNYPIIPGTNARIGKYPNDLGESRMFNGCIDDIRVYNYFLSDTEIQSLYHEGGW